MSAMPHLAALLVLSGLLGAQTVDQGPVSIQVGTAQRLLRVAAVADRSRHLISTGNGTVVTMRWGDQIRAFVTEKQRDDMPAENYAQFSLLGQELSYDLDLGNVGCSCNAALFFTSMPGRNPDGTIARGKSNLLPYYCDSNDVGGVWCWEHDTVESNKYTIATTPHRCDRRAGAYIDSCDGAGCQTNSWFVDAQGLCPAAHCRIDTRFPFRIFQRFDTQEGELSRIHNRLVQGQKSFEWDVCGNTSYLAAMSGALHNMTMVFQLWGNQTGSWLDKMTGCNETCNIDTATVTFGRISIMPIK